ncbi:MAG: tetratricopeptide repeat protein [Elusimicrobia bacterium]|nr:tetratricopeptide repeat protein [Elusimicrobiota bacterium]
MNKIKFLISALIILTLSTSAYASNFAAYRSYLRGLIALRSGNISKAIAQYEQTIRMDPSALGVLKELTYIYFQTGNLPKALATAQRIKELDPYTVRTNSFLGTFYLISGQMTLAKEAFERVLQLDPHNEVATVYLAAYYYSGRRFELAVNYWERFLNLSPNNAQGYFQLALAQERLGLNYEALASFSRVIEINPNARQAYLAKARIYQNVGNFTLAAAQYERYLELFPGNVNVMLYLGRAHVELGNTRRAEEIFIRARNANPDNILVRFWLAALYEKTGEINKAIREFEHIVRRDPTPSSLIRLGFYHAKLQNFSQAERMFLRALEKDPESVDTRYLLGLLYIDKGNFRQAQAFLEEVVYKNPSNIDALFHLATVRDRLNNFEAAEYKLKQVIEKDPNHTRALNYLGYRWAERNENLEEAEVLLRRALAIEPLNPAFLDSLGWIFYRQQRFVEAQHYILRAASIMADPVIYEHLGDVNVELENVAKAWLSYAIASDLGSSSARRKMRAAQRNLDPQIHAVMTLARAEANFRRLQSFRSSYRLEVRYRGSNINTFINLTYERNNYLRLDFPPRLMGGQNYAVLQNRNLTFHPQALEHMLPEGLSEVISHVPEIIASGFFVRFALNEPVIRGNRATFTSADGNSVLVLNLNTGHMVSLSKGDNLRITFNRHQNFNNSYIPQELTIEMPAQRVRIRARLRNINPTGAPR